MNTKLYNLLKLTESGNYRLEDFLIEEGILELFIENYDSNSSLESALNDTYCDIISASFSWADTEQGHRFWCCYNSLWERRSNEYNNL